jgi:hypothetical protein
MGTRYSTGEKCCAQMAKNKVCACGRNGRFPKCGWRKLENDSSNRAASGHLAWSRPITGLHRWTARAGRSRAGRSLANMILAVLPFLALSPGAAAQPSVSLNEFWPEFDAFIRLNEKSRIFLVYSATKQQNLGAYSDGQAGAYIDFYAVRQLRPHLISYVDPARSKSLMLRAGYSVSRPTGNFISPTEHIVTVEATGRAHLPAGFLLSDRSRVDLRWVAGHPNDRYRNRAKLERAFQAGRFQLTPYAHGEFYYDFRLSKWTKWRWAAGAEWAITRRIVLEGYLLRQDTWRSVPRFVSGIGLTLQFFFR